MPSTNATVGSGVLELAVDRPAPTDERRNFCPFGCDDADLDEYGYCVHLIGFRNEGKKFFEPIRPWLVRDKDGKKMIPTGQASVQGGPKGKSRRSCPPPSADVEYVNPEKKQLINGVVNMAKSWVSDRLYVRNPDQFRQKGDYLPEPYVPDEDEVAAPEE